MNEKRAFVHFLPKLAQLWPGITQTSSNPFNISEIHASISYQIRESLT
jgi:hypothetical protein